MIRVQPVWSQVRLVGACWLWCLEAGPWLVLPQGVCLTVRACPLELASLVVTDFLVTEGCGLYVERVNAVMRVGLLEPHYFGPTKWFSAPANVSTVSAENSSVFCPNIIGVYMSWLIYFCFEPLLVPITGQWENSDTFPFNQRWELFGVLVIIEGLFSFHSEYLLSPCSCVWSLQLQQCFSCG